jgi:hypothetical protein
VDNSAIEQEVQIASAEAAKLIEKEGVTIPELRELRKNIDEKRKSLARPLRVTIKEIDRLFDGPIQKLKDAAQALGNDKSK